MAEKKMFPDPPETLIPTKREGCSLKRSERTNPKSPLEVSYDVHVTGEVVGVVTFTPFGRGARVGGIYCEMTKEVEGRGLVTPSVRALRDELLRCGYSEFIAKIDGENKPAIKVLRNLDFGRLSNRDGEERWIYPAPPPGAVAQS